MKDDMAVYSKYLGWPLSFLHLDREESFLDVKMSNNRLIGNCFL